MESSKVEHGKEPADNASITPLITDRVRAINSQMLWLSLLDYFVFEQILNETARNHFLVFMKYAGSNLIEIPTDFISKWGIHIINPISMSSSTNGDWRVDVNSASGKMWLGRGWDDIATAKLLGHEDAILFRYIGQTRFHLTFFDNTGVEKSRPMDPLGRLPVHFFKSLINDVYLKRLLPRKFTNVYDGAMTNPISIFLENMTTWTVEWFDDGADIWFHGGWEDVVQHCGLSSTDFLLFDLRTNSQFYMKIARGERQTATAMKRITPAAAPLVFYEKTLWTIKLSKSHIGAKKPLYIPPYVVDIWFNRKPTIVDVVVPSGEKQRWSIIWSTDNAYQIPRRREGHFGFGWQDFVVANKIPVGKSLRFYKRSNEGFIRLDFVTHNHAETGVAYVWS